MDEKRLESEYRRLKQQEAPDLWNRIEANLKDHPGEEKAPERTGHVPSFQHERRIFQMSAAAAAVVAAVIAVRVTLPGQKGGALIEKSVMMETMAETALQVPEGEAGAVMGDGAPDTWEEEDASESKMARSAGKGAEDEAMPELTGTPKHPIRVPVNAVTVPEDEQYFCEELLSDAELLCGGMVTEAFLEKDSSGKAVKVVYEVSLDQVYYAEDYTTGMEKITVKSPIVKTDGDEAYILYQLQAGGTYLLPLWKQEGEWELLYPFAPQIQVTESGAYLFHSGYVSLMNQNTSVVKAEPEGRNDYYYDRMLMRKDDNFLSELIGLIE